MEKLHSFFHSQYESITWTKLAVSIIGISTASVYIVSKIIVYRSKNIDPKLTETDKAQSLKQLVITQQQTGKNIKIGYKEYGNVNSKNVIFYLHGYPGSCLDLDAFYPFLFKASKYSNNIRVIGLDRPGHGLSSYYDFTPETYASDLLQLADKLNIDSFIVSGVSGGAPFVLGCAVYIPCNRLKCVICMVGIMPFDTVINPYKGGIPANKIIFGTPYTFGAWLLYLGVLSLNENEDINNVIATMPLQYDKDVMIKYPFLHKATSLSFKNQIRNGIAGTIRMHLIAKYYKMWGFTVEDLCNNSGNKVYAFYAVQDVNVSISHGEWFRNQTKGYEHVSVEFCDGYGHCSFLVNGSKYMSKVIDEIFDYNEK